MNLRLLAAASVAVLISTPAFAFHCPVDIAAIDEALAQDPALTAEQRAEVEELRAEGEDLHDGGDHGGAIAALHRAMEILGIAHE